MLFGCVCIFRIVLRCCCLLYTSGKTEQNEKILCSELKSFAGRYGIGNYGVFVNVYSQWFNQI